jgi:hypothetical protein
VDKKLLVNLHHASAPQLKNCAVNFKDNGVDAHAYDVMQCRKIARTDCK